MFLRTLVTLYSWSLTKTYAQQIERLRFRPFRFFGWFWQTHDFGVSNTISLSQRSKKIRLFVSIGILLQIGLSMWLLVEWARYGTSGFWEFGAAVFISYPVVWALLLTMTLSVGWLFYFLSHPKKLGRALVCAVLEHQVKVLQQKHDFKVVAVLGSVGKTSTKLAVAKLVSENLRVLHQEGNYNDRVTVPLIFFDQTEPNILNVFSWLRIFQQNKRTLKNDYPYDVVVIELGTDGPGYIQEFEYLSIDLAIVTAVAPEHMEFFKTIDAVASEELAVFEFVKTVLVNADDIAGKYLVGRTFLEYSLESEHAKYYAKQLSKNIDGQTLDINLPDGKIKSARIKYLGIQGAKFALAATAAADILGMNRKDIKTGLEKLEHFAGRMQLLNGIQNARLIDDTYNSSPVAAKAALDVLYAAKSKQRIAILGSMNELGEYAPEAHKEVGLYCDSKKLSLVVTIGDVANKYLAPIAKEQGCTVKKFSDPYKAGAYVKSILEEGSVILAKGSQNHVFAEESLKILLRDPDDETKLVRQSKYWLNKKKKQFS